MKVGAALAADVCIPTAALNAPGADVSHSLHRLGVDAWVRAGRVNCRGQDLVARSAKCL